MKSRKFEESPKSYTSRMLSIVGKWEWAI